MSEPICNNSDCFEEGVSLVYVPVTLPTDMLAESEDLLQQLSSDMTSAGLSDFMEDDCGSSSSGSSVVGAANNSNSNSNTIDTFLDLATSGGMTADELCAADHGYLNGILNTDGDLT